MKSPQVHFAVRFAAREAFLKALGTGLVAPFSWKEIEIIRDPDGKPQLVFHGEVARHLLRIGSPSAHLSLTHTRSTAAAVVVLEKI